MAHSAASLTLSPTKVDVFFGCRRLFRYRFIAPPFTPPENRYFLIGNVAHRALETLHKEHLVTPISNWKKAMGQHFRDAAKSHNVDKKIATGVITKSDLFSIKDMMRKYLVHLDGLDAIPKVHKVEALKKINIGGVVVWLKADRIDMIKDHMYRVVDYKSGRPANRKDEQASVQIPSYGILVRQLIDKAAAIEGSYVYLKFLDTKNGVHNYKITDEWMDQATEQYVKVDKALKNGCDFKQNFKYKYCFTCDFKRHCLNDKDND